VDKGKNQQKLEQYQLSSPAVIMWWVDERSQAIGPAKQKIKTSRWSKAALGALRGA